MRDYNSIIIGFDTETVKVNGEQTFLSAQFFSKENQIESFIYDENVLEKFLRKYCINKILLCLNAEFDIAVLRKAIKSEKFIFKLYYNSGKLVFGNIVYGKNRIKIYDLGNIFVNWSLSKIGEFLNMPKLEKPTFLGIRKPENKDEWEYFINYAMNDAKIAYYAGKWIIKKFGILRSTLPSIALSYYRFKYRPNKIFLSCDEAIEEKLRLAYHGGRVEAWVRGTPSQNVNVYDVNSLYPYVMKYNMFPSGKTEIKMGTDINFDKFGIAKCLIKQQADIPILSTKIIGKDGNAKLVFPNGTFEGYFTFPELEYFQNQKLGKILKVYESIYVDFGQYFFVDYVNDFYQLKLKDKKYSSFWKLMLNALYGKFAQKPYNLPYISFLPNMIQKPENLESKRKNIKTNILLASYITAYARIYMHKLFSEIGSENICYTDTDSIHTFKTIESNDKELGKLKFELCGKPTYIKSKFYLIKNEVKIKGLPKIFDADFIRACIQKDCLIIPQTIMLKMRSAYIRKKPFLAEVLQIKHFNLEEDEKRKYIRKLKPKQLLTEYTNSIPIKIGE